MKTSGNSKRSYRAVTGIFFVLTVLVVALTGFLPTKTSASVNESADKPAVVKSADTTKEANLNREDWLRIAKAL